MCSAGATHVRPIVPPASRANLVSEVNSSALLMGFARALWLEKILPMFDKMPRGHGGDFDALCENLAMLCCPLDSGRVALGLVIDGIGCSCSVAFPTPTASDWKGGHDIAEKYRQFNLRDWWRKKTGSRYMPIAFLEAVQGFPDMWTKLDV